MDVDPTDPTTIFVAAATGGLWRSTDGGLVWDPVFDDQPVLGIGSVAVSPANPDLIWVGTGEGNPRNSVGVGAGLYRSLDGGDTWQLMGLRDSERIHRVIPHPTDPDVVYAGSMGPAWSDGEERGVWRSTDGGESWNRVLYVDQRTGVADLVMDPANPNKLIAAMWEFRRWPWSFQSGGPGSGLFITYDGGDSWTQITPEDGLPGGELGRIGLAFAPSAPGVVYALVEATRNTLLRSEDGGRTWNTVNDDDGVNPRPFYYADLRVDPTNENRIYRLASSIDVSEDGGREFQTVVPSRIIHGDVHELWLDPDDSRRMIMGNDGGIAFTYNRGETWRFVENLPLAQFYHINVDMDVPFNVYGGLQDNGSWYGPSQVWEDMGIMNAHWRRTGGGDGFASIVDFSNPRFGYSMSQQGSLMRFDKVTGERRSIQPVAPGGEDLRFNWNAGFNIDPRDSTTIYLGSQFVHRSRDGGLSWEVISPDLTTNDPEKQRQDESGGLTLDATGAENHTTILSIAPSPIADGLIWVTTDDGNVQITRDAGGNWTNLASEIPDVPDSTYAPHIEPSKHDPAVAYLVYDDHRRGNWTPYVFRTEDYGNRWRSLETEGLPGFVHAIEEDPVEPNLLFLGTEFGLYISLDRGDSWLPWRHGVPAVPVRAVMVHPRDHDLVLGTHGRAAYVLDDIRPLRGMASMDPEGSGAPRLFEPPPAYQVHIAERIGYRSYGHAMFFGDNRPPGAMISFWAPPGDDARPAEVSIRMDSGEEVWSGSFEARSGVNRINWDLRKKGGGESGGPFSPPGPQVIPGAFTVELRLDGIVDSVSLQVLADPRVSISTTDRQAKTTAMEQALAWSALSSEARDQLERARMSVGQAVERLEGAGNLPLRAQAADVKAALDSTMERLFTGPDCQGICGGDPLAGPVRTPLFLLSSSGGAPSANDRAAMTQALEALRGVVLEVNRVLREEVVPLRNALTAGGHTSLPEFRPLPMPVGGG